MDAMIAVVRQTVADHDLLEPKSPLVLMVSGGSDSVALARLLPQLYPQSHFVVLHLNHQLRGDASDRDAAFVRALCDQLGLECHVEHVDVAAWAKNQNDNLEQAGRKVRYALAEKLLDELCERLGVPKQLGRIATAHTMDDRAETFLMRVIVGAGSGSLASIPFRRGRVVRPLLNCRKQQLRDWLRAQTTGADEALWREDASNADPEQARAFVRHELLPLLSQRNPGIVATLAKSADVLATESDYLTAAAKGLLPLTNASFDAPLALLRKAVYLAVDDAMCRLAPDARVSFEHIDAIVHEGRHPGFARHLPGGIEVRNIKGELHFLVAKPPQHDPRRKD